MKPKIYSLTILLAFVTLNLFSQIDRSQPPEPGPAPVIEVGQAEEFTLDNGLKVFVVTNEKLPRVTYNMILDTDPMLEGENKGYVSLAGRLLRTGTTTRTKEEIDEAIDYIGARLSTSSSGFYATALTRHNESLLEIVSDIIKNARLTEEELDRLKTRTVSDIAAERTDPGSIMNRMSRRVVYGENHPYGESRTEETIENVTLEMCKEYYNTHFKPNVAYLAIVGDITKDEIKPLLEEYFGDWQPGEVPSRQYDKPELPGSRKVSMVDRQNAVQSTIQLGYPVELTIDHDIIMPSRVMNTILGGGFFRLNENLREEHGFTYGAYSRLSPDNQIGRFTAQTDVRNIATDSAITEILYEMNRIVSEIVPENELNRAKNYMTGSFALSLEQPQTIARFAINVARFGLPGDYYTNYLKNLEQVTAEDVQHAAREFIYPENTNVMVVGKASEVAENLKQFAMDDEIHYYDIHGNPVEGEVGVREVSDDITVTGVIDKYIEALGGRSNMENITDITQTMTGSIMGQNLEITQYQKKPNLILIETKAGGQVASKQLFDGEKFVVQSPMGQQQFEEGEPFENMKVSAVLNRELYYEDYDIQKELEGIETINGKDAYKVKSTLPTGSTVIDYFDVNTGLKIKTLKDEAVTEIVEYMEFEQYQFPKIVKQEMGPQTVQFEVIDVKINTGLTKDDFTIE